MAFHARIRFALVASALAILRACPADQALVIGIEEYKPLVAASTLKGCANDAAGIAEALKKDGFNVHFMINEEATKQGILQALAKLKTTCTPKERFVFYYAGHGRSAPRYALMPSDATYEGNDISPKELNDAILAIPARSRTVILDSCFSGGMAAGEMSRGMDDFKPRYFDEEQARSVKFGVPPKPTNQKDSTKPLAGNSGICYYTAALSSEQALEAMMPDGKRHGLFTYALLNNLKDGEVWSSVHDGVKKTIEKRLEDSGRTQNPMISTEYMGSPALDPIVPNAKPIPSKTLLDVWNQDNPNPAMVALNLQPNQDVLEAGHRLSLDVQVGDDGYLIIFGQVGDHFYQFYPAGSVLAKDAAVKKGTISFPGDKAMLFFDDFGADHLKAMLFSSADAAQSVLDAMQSANGKPKDLVLARSVEQPAFTSRVSIAVSDSLVGGLRLKNLESLYSKIMSQKTPVEKYLVDRMRDAGAGYDKGSGWLANVDPDKAPSLEDKEAFITLVNLAIQNGLLYDETAFKGVKFPRKVKDGLANPPVDKALWALNRAILAAAFPKEVNADDARGR